MKANFIFLFCSLFMLHKILAFNHYWDIRLNDQIKFMDDVRARLRELSIGELQNMIQHVEAFELEKKLEKERENRLQEEERMKKKREEEMRQTKIKSFIERHFGTFGSFFKDFFANGM
jgi:hypothetical protein